MPPKTEVQEKQLRMEVSFDKSKRRVTTTYYIEDDSFRRGRSIPIATITAKLDRHGIITKQKMRMKPQYNTVVTEQALKNMNKFAADNASTKAGKT